MKNFNIMGVYWKILFLGGNFLKGGGGAWTVFRFKVGLAEEEGGGVFEGGGYTPIHAMVQQKFFVNAP